MSQNELSFLHQCGADGPAPAPQEITVGSNGAALSDWTATVTGGDDWLQVSKTSGKVSRIFDDWVEVSVTPTMTCPFTGTAQIQIHAAGLGNSPQTVAVNLRQSASLSKLYLPLIIKNGGGLLALERADGSALDRIVLLVGVADYLHLTPPPTFSVLRSGEWGWDIIASRSDDFAMRKKFQDQECGLSLAGGRAINQVCPIRVINLSEEDATQENINYALEWIAARVDADTEVLFYFSGHGGPLGDDASPVDEADETDELLGVYDTDDTPDFVRYILDDDFKTRLANLETEHLAVILDACNSGGMEVLNPHRAVLAASREDQNSWESSELEHGVFTYYMLQAMEDPASDTNGDCWVSVEEVYYYARTLVDNYVWENPPPGEPRSHQNLTLDLTTDFRLVPIACDH